MKFKRHPVPKAIFNQTRCRLIGSQIEVADSFMSRLVGLLGRNHLDPGSGLLIRPSSGVHTFGMRFPIDVVALDRRLRVVAAQSDVRPWRTSGLGLRTHSVLELPAGSIRQNSIERGDQLEILESPAPSAVRRRMQGPGPVLMHR